MNGGVYVHVGLGTRKGGGWWCVCTCRARNEERRRMVVCMYM